MRRRTAVWACVTAALLLTGAARVTRADGVDDYLKAQMAARHIPGLSVAVVQDGKIVKSAGYGQADAGLSVPAAADTIYPIGSLSKQFTAVGVMLLVQEGKVRLDDPLSKYLAEMPATWRSITVRELLNQTSGIPEWVPNPDKDPLLRTYSLAEIARHAAAEPLAFPPGTQFAYSNTNYNLLAGIIEKASGKTYGAFLSERLFRPLGLDSTGEYDPEQVVPRRASGYNRAAGKVYSNIVFSDTSYYKGAGGLESTAGDLAKWDEALTSGKVLPLPVLAQMWTPPALPGGAATSYGMGWEVQTVGKHRLIWHNGAIPGCLGYSGRFPDDHLTVVLLSNLFPLDGPDDSPPFFALGRGVAALYIPDLAKEDAGIPDTEPQVAALLKRVSAQLAAGTLDKSQFAPALRAQLSPAAVDPAHDLLAPLGPLTALTLVQRDPSGVALYRAVYGTAVVRWQIRVDKEGKITDLRPTPE